MGGCLLAGSDLHLQKDKTSLIAHARCADDVTVTLHTVARRMLAANVTATLGVDVPEGASGEQDFSHAAAWCQATFVLTCQLSVGGLLAMLSCGCVTLSSMHR